MPEGNKPVGPWGASRARRQCDYLRYMAAPDLNVVEAAGGRQCKHRELVRTPTCFGSRATQAIERLGLRVGCGCRLRRGPSVRVNRDDRKGNKVRGSVQEQGWGTGAGHAGIEKFSMTGRICGPAFLCFGRKAVSTYTREKESLKGR